MFHSGSKPAKWPKRLPRAEASAPHCGWCRRGPQLGSVRAYPYLLAGIFKLFGVFTYKSYLVSQAIDISFAAFTCWPIYAIGTKVFGRRIGIASAWIWALLPTAVYIPRSGSGTPPSQVCGWRCLCWRHSACGDRDVCFLDWLRRPVGSRCDDQSIVACRCCHF